jgi:hypothetical protein
MLACGVMVNKRVSVTQGVTDSYLEEMSTRGYDFIWDVAVDGYEWENDRLTFDEELAEERYHGLWRSEHIGFSYDKDTLLMNHNLNRNVITMHEVYPEPCDVHAPWLVEKGSVALSLKRSLTTPRREWKGIPTRQYRPLSTRTLHRQFASLNTESLETEVLRFANKYGMLGRSVFLTSYGERLGIVEGESIYRWRTEVEKMGVLLAIWDLIRQGDRAAGKLGQFLIWRDSDCVEVRLKWRYQEGQYEISKWDGQGKVAGFGHIHEIVANRELEPDFFNEYQRGYVIDPAWYYLGYKLNNHLYGIRPKLVGYHEREVAFIPRTLLDGLWLLFMLEVYGKTRAARCGHCGQWFDFSRGSKIYCNGNCRRLACYHRKKLETKGVEAK